MECLDDVESIIDIAYGDLGDLEGASLDACQELLQLAGLDPGPPPSECAPGSCASSAARALGSVADAFVTVTQLLWRGRA